MQAIGMVNDHTLHCFKHPVTVLKNNEQPQKE